MFGTRRVRFLLAGTTLVAVTRGLLLAGVTSGYPAPGCLGLNRSGLVGAARLGPPHVLLGDLTDQIEVACARQIAHGSQDVQTVVWVRGHEVVRSLYEGRSPAVVMQPDRWQGASTCDARPAR